MQFDYIDVTSHDEPDPDWSYTDPAGHVHNYNVQTTRYVVDDEGSDEYPEIGHHECVQCGARVRFGRKATQFRQYMRVSYNPLADILAVRESETGRIAALTREEQIARLRAEYTNLRIFERGSANYWRVVSALRAMGVEVLGA